MLSYKKPSQKLNIIRANDKAKNIRTCKRLLTKGLSNKEIAVEMSLNIRTINKYIQELRDSKPANIYKVSRLNKTDDEIERDIFNLFAKDVMLRWDVYSDMDDEELIENIMFDYNILNKSKCKEWLDLYKDNVGLS